MDIDTIRMFLQDNPLVTAFLGFVASVIGVAVTRVLTRRHGTSKP